MLDENTFWEIVERIGQIPNDEPQIEQTEHVPSAQENFGVALLAQYSEEDILQYERIFDKYMDEAYSWNLWAAAYIINCGCSNDGFTDFRTWLIFQEKPLLYSALENPEILVDYVDLTMETMREDLGYGIIFDAWELKTGKSVAEIPSSVREPAEVKGEKWPEEGTYLKISIRFYTPILAIAGACSIR